jgi:rod shape-determining protein MreB and related proteins
MARDLAIDLGTANTLVWTRGRGIVLNEPTVIALNQRTGEVLAMGQPAYSMIGRTPGHIVAERPLRGGAITDFDTTARLIKLVLQRVGVRRMARPRVLICVPSAITEVERRAVQEREIPDPLVTRSCQSRSRFRKLAPCPYSIRLSIVL